MLSRLRRSRACTLIGFLLAVLGAGSELLASGTGAWSYVDADGARHDFEQTGTCDNVTDGGLIDGDVRGCPNPTYQAPTLTNATLPSGGTGELEYAWMTTETDPNAGGRVTWRLIPNTNSPDYTPPPLTSTAYFMRCARRVGCSEYAGETNFVTVEVDCCDNVTDGGAIDGAQEVCGVPYQPSVIRNVTAASGGSNATQYQWYRSTTSDTYAIGDAAWAPIDGATNSFYTPGALTGVTHFVRTARKEFCEEIGAFSNVVTISARPLPTADADIVPASCDDAADGEIDVTIQQAAAPYTYRWLDDATQDLRRTGLVAGVYTFEITDVYGCVGTVDLTVDAPAELVASAEAEADLCDFADDAVVRAVVTGGTEPYSYLWNTGATDAELTGQPAGTYVVDVTDANGCTAQATVEVAPPPAFSANVAFTDPVCYQPDGTIDVTPVGGTAPYTYAWSHDPGLTGPSATGLPGGDYTVVATDANGCEATVAASLDDTPDIAIALDVDDVSCNGGNDGNVRSTVTGGQPPYSYSWSNGATTADLTGVSAGTYTLELTDDNGCIRTAEAIVAEPLELTASIDVVQPVCREDGGTLTAVIAGGTPPYTFDWGTVGRERKSVV